MNIDNLGNKEILSKNLKFYMDYYKKDAIKVCKDLNIPASTFSDWLNCKKYPRIDKLELLANYFNIKKSDLIEERNENNISEFDILFDKYKGILSDKDKEMITFIIEQRKKEIDEQENI